MTNPMEGMFELPQASLGHIHTDIRSDMTCITTQHFSVNRILLLAVGLWPYQESKFVRLQTAFIFIMLISSIIFQLTVFVTAEYNVSYVIKILSCTLFIMSIVIQYLSFSIKSKAVKLLLEQLQHMRNRLKDNNEIVIIEKYGYIAKRYTVKLTLVCMCSVILISFPMWQSFFRGTVLLRRSQLRHPLKIETEYFIDQEKYSSIILLHMTTAFGVGIIIVTGTGSMLVAYLKYACGMFSIASYRIEQAMMLNTLSNDNHENDSMIYKKIISAVDIHRKALEISEFLISSFDGSFFLLIIVNVAGLSLNLFQIFQIASLENIAELSLHSVLALIIITCMFLANYIGQEITDHNNQVFFTAYHVQWYTAPLRMQKLMLFLLQKGSKVFGLKVGGLFIASLECFSKLASASMSYFTVLYSLQK